jgi:hypothetical protein
MKKPGIVLIILIVSSSVFGQSQWKPWVVAEGGTLWGGYEFTGDVRLQGGMKTNGWLIGAGAAYDPYRYRTMPIYVQGRKMFTQGSIKPFILASIGASLEMEKDQEQPVETTPIWGRWIAPAYQYSNGMYAEGGLGLAFRAKKRIGFNLSLSYTYKSLEETYNDNTWTGVANESSTVKNKYMMNRLACRLGLQF